MGNILRITHTLVAEVTHRVDLECEFLSKEPTITASAEFEFDLTAQTLEDLRWYFEDYPEYPTDPQPQIAARIERRLAEIGAELFQKVFDSNDAVRSLWHAIRPHLPATRVAIDAKNDAVIPWELMRDPATEVVLAKVTQAFVRARSHQPTGARPPRNDNGPIRILLAICRPAADEDIPFRSAASRILRALQENQRGAFTLDVLRPPTFEALASLLRQAKASGSPYDVVHFDGHGTYDDVSQLDQLSTTASGPNPLLLSPARDGMHGYVLFESPALDENMQLVDGPALGQLLWECEVRVLILDSCRSAYAEAPTAPIVTGKRERNPSFDSLAQEVMQYGLNGIVAMSYSVYVFTAAQFVADLYTALAAGLSLGDAVTQGRKQLAAQPLRETPLGFLPIQDWCVPVVYEARPVALFSKREVGVDLKIIVKRKLAAPSLSSNDRTLAISPEAGFIGRDETVLTLDRAFDRNHLVLLFGAAGAGKTATAVDFADWYWATGGVRVPALFTSFQRHRTLPEVLDELGKRFDGQLSRQGIHWLALTDEDRRSVSLGILSQVPVLWVWDNVEPIAGFPSNVRSEWTDEEQRDLASFLQEAGNTRAKFLLTSRRDERAWLGDLPTQALIPPMPFRESMELVEALVTRRGRRVADVEDWRPMVHFAQGNPLTLTVLTSQALRERLVSRVDVERFVRRVQSGEGIPHDDEEQGRSRSLSASLGYGFQSAFDDTELSQLAVVHLFQGFVHVQVLLVMGLSKEEWFLPELRGLTETNGIGLLARLAEIGLLTQISETGGFLIHPALPWFLKTPFDRYYPGDRRLPVVGAFVEALGKFGLSFLNLHELGVTDRSVQTIELEEANFLNALRLARTTGRWLAVCGILHALLPLYHHTGRNAQWVRIVYDVLPDYIDETTGRPFPGREEGWGIVMDQLARFAADANELQKAVSIRSTLIASDRDATRSTLGRDPKSWKNSERTKVRSLAISLGHLGDILRQQSDPSCVQFYEEAMSLYRLIEDRQGDAIRAFNLGHAYKNVPALQSLDQAEHWYQYSLVWIIEKPGT